MAMNASKVTDLAHVELEDLGMSALESQSVIRQYVRKGLAGREIKVSRQCHFQKVAIGSGCYSDRYEASDSTNYAECEDRRQDRRAQSTWRYGTFATKFPTDRDAGEVTRAADPES